MASDFSADQSYPRIVVGRNLLTTYEYDANYTTVKSLGRAYESPFAIWQYAYTGIERANWVIARVPTTPMDVTRRTQIVAEAYFLRAFYHWTLAKNFNEIWNRPSPGCRRTRPMTAAGRVRKPRRRSAPKPRSITKTGSGPCSRPKRSWRAVRWA